MKQKGAKAASAAKGDIRQKEPEETQRRGEKGKVLGMLQKEEGSLA